MKRLWKIVTIAAVLVAVGSVIYVASVSNAPAGRMDAPKIMSAARTYSTDLKARGAEVPASVNLKELIARGLLTEADVSAFAGLDVTVSLAGDFTQPHEVLLRARQPNGPDIVLLGDGSVQQLKR